MLCSTPFERAYWAALYALFEAGTLQSEIELALREERCPEHLGAIWETHVRMETAENVRRQLARAAATQPLSNEDFSRKRVLEDILAGLEREAASQTSTRYQTERS